MLLICALSIFLYRLRNLRFIKILKIVAQFALLLYRFYFFLAQFALALFRFNFFLTQCALAFYQLKILVAHLRLRFKIF